MECKVQMCAFYYQKMYVNTQDWCISPNLNIMNDPLNWKDNNGLVNVVSHGVL